MFVRRVCSAAVAMAMLTLIVANAGADVPLTKEVFYKIHEDPADPNSPIIFTVGLLLEEADTDGDAIGWKITEMLFRQPVAGMNGDRLWSVTDPTVSTADGLWWVEHPSANIELADFDLPPELDGVATAEDPNDVDLNYSLAGAPYSPPPGGAPWDPTAALEFEFTEDGESTPLLATGSGDPVPNEPVEIDDEDDEPI